MDEIEYHKLLNNAKSQEEFDKINEQYTKSIHFQVMFKKFKSFLFNHLFDIINSVITLLALIVAILSLLLQLKEQ